MSGIGRLRDQQKKKEGMSGMSISEVPPLRHAEGGREAGPGARRSPKVPKEPREPLSGASGIGAETASFNRR